LRDFPGECRQNNVTCFAKHIEQYVTSIGLPLLRILSIFCEFAIDLISKTETRVIEISSISWQIIGFSQGKMLSPDLWTKSFSGSAMFTKSEKKSPSLI
jgi:hypothetical protein